jgi:hypothetical protein
MSTAAAHSLFPYDDEGKFVERIAAFLGRGAELGDASLAVVDRAKWDMLCEGLGDGAPHVAYTNRDEAYTRPEETLATYDALLRRTVDEGAPAVRLYGELPRCETPEQRDTWIRYEALLNPVFAQCPVTIVCGYDLREHPEDVVAGAWHTHPTVLADTAADNPRYEDPAQIVAATTVAPEPLPDLRDVFLDDDRAAFADRLRGELSAARGNGGAADALLRAAMEVFANAQTHGHGARAQRLGRVGERVVWELSDNGPGCDDPLAGYLPPENDGAHGSGLWKARQLTHRLEMFRSPRGFTTRLWV